MRRTGLIAATVAAMGALALSGCGGGSVTPGGPGESEPAEPVLEGRWVAEDPADAFLEFEEPAEDGTGHMSGSDGCNGVQGEYTLDGDTAELERGFGTLKGCPGVDTWLHDVVSVTVDGEELTVLDDDGEEIGTLARES